MDRFKFRVWDKQLKEMILYDGFNDNFILGNDGKLYKRDTNYYNSDYFEEVTNQYTICQCTGLKDKNGKLIYEWDILADTGDYIDGIVAYLDGKYYLVDNDGYAADSDYAYEPDEWNKCEIIGNKFENPELLQ